MDLLTMKHIVVADTIDRVINTDFHGKGLYPIYDAIRREMGLPLTYLAADGMLRRLEQMNKDDVVLIGTGFLIDPYLKPETDGLISAALLARALEYVFHVTPVIVSEAQSLEALHWTCTTAEMSVTDDLALARKNRNTVCLLPISLDLAEARRQADALLAETNCRLMVSIERPGANEFGIYHSALGNNISQKVAKIDYLFEQVRVRGGFTVGVGDLGNELGVGNTQAALKPLIPFGGACNCGCGGGTVTATVSSAPMMGCSSEIAVYGLLAALQELSGKSDILCSPGLQRRVLERAALHGAVDGQDRRSSASVDIMTADSVERVVAVLHDVLLHGNRHTDNRPEFLQYVAAMDSNPYDLSH